MAASTTLISVAPTGAEADKSAVPALPAPQPVVGKRTFDEPR
jgi:hypothetical protein